MRHLGVTLVLFALAPGNAVEQSQKSKKYFGMSEPTATTTSDDLMDFSFDDLGGADGNGTDAADCNPAKTGCANSSHVPVEVRYPDVLFEQLIVQLWSDLREDPGLSDARIDPLDVDALLKKPVALKQTGAMYQADVKMHNISVLGLSTLTMKSVEASRSENLTDLSVRVVITCPIISVKGLYSLKGTFGWWLLDSQGLQKFSISMVNVSVAISVSVEMNEKTTCDSEGQAHVSSIEIPLAYDDVDFRFDKLGSFANQVVNGVGIYFLQSQEELLVGKLRSVIKAKANSLIC